MARGLFIHVSVTDGTDLTLCRDSSTHAPRYTKNIRGFIAYYGWRAQEFSPTTLFLDLRKLIFDSLCTCRKHVSAPFLRKFVTPEIGCSHASQVRTTLTAL